jgi:hypothetical protein
MSHRNRNRAGKIASQQANKENGIQLFLGYRKGLEIRRDELTKATLQLNDFVEPELKRINQELERLGYCENEMPF